MRPIAKRGSGTVMGPGCDVGTLSSLKDVQSGLTDV